jgi:hypothetical protein
MKNKQIEIILGSIEKSNTHDYVVETFYLPIKQIKDTIAKGLKSMKVPIADEDLSTIKSSFMRFEMEIDKNLQQEMALLPVLLSEQGLGKEESEKISLNLQKEKNVVATMHEILDQSNAKCQVYDLLKQALYKSEDRMDVLNHFMKD